MEWKWYRYFEPKTVGLDFEGMMEDIKSAPEGSVIILHGAQLFDLPILIWPPSPLPQKSLHKPPCHCLWCDMR